MLARSESLLQKEDWGPCAHKRSVPTFVSGAISHPGAIRLTSDPHDGREGRYTRLAEVGCVPLHLLLEVVAPDLPMGEAAPRSGETQGD